MITNDNTVSLQQIQNVKMKSEKLIYYSVDELNKLYPTIIPRGWTNEHFALWINQDLLSGIYENNNFETVRVEKESFEAFLEYHTNFINRRNERLQEGLDNFKTSKLEDKK